MSLFEAEELCTYTAREARGGCRRRREITHFDQLNKGKAMGEEE